MPVRPEAPGGTTAPDNPTQPDKTKEQKIKPAQPAPAPTPTVVQPPQDKFTPMAQRGLLTPQQKDLDSSFYRPPRRTPLTRKPVETPVEVEQPLPIEEKIWKIDGVKLPTDVVTALVESGIDSADMLKAAIQLAEAYDLPSFYFDADWRAQGILPALENVTWRQQWWVNPQTGESMSGADLARQFNVQEVVFWANMLNTYQPKRPKYGSDFRYEMNAENMRDIYNSTVEQLGGDIDDIDSDKLIGQVMATTGMMQSEEQVGKYLQNVKYINENLPGVGKDLVLPLAAAASALPLEGQETPGVLANPAEAGVVYTQAFSPDGRQDEVLNNYAAAQKIIDRREAIESGPTFARGGAVDSSSGADFMAGLITGDEKVDEYFLKTVEGMYNVEHWGDFALGGLKDTWEGFKKVKLPGAMQVGDFTGSIGGMFDFAGRAIDTGIYGMANGLAGLGMYLQAAIDDDLTIEDAADWMYGQNLRAGQILTGERSAAELIEEDTGIPAWAATFMLLVPQVVFDPFVIAGRSISAAKRLRTIFGTAAKYNKAVKAEEARIFKELMASGNFSAEGARQVARSRALAQNYDILDTFRAAAIKNLTRPRKLWGGKSISDLLYDATWPRDDLTAFRKFSQRIRFGTKKSGGSMFVLEKIRDVAQGMRTLGIDEKRIRAVINEAFLAIQGVRPGAGASKEVARLLEDLATARVAKGPFKGKLLSLGHSESSAKQLLDKLPKAVQIEGTVKDVEAVERHVLDLIDNLPAYLTDDVDSVVRARLGLAASGDAPAALAAASLGRTPAGIGTRVGFKGAGAFFETPKVKRVPMLRHIIGNNLSPERQKAWYALFAKVPTMMMNVETDFPTKLREILEMSAAYTPNEVEGLVKEAARLTSKHIPNREDNFVRFVQKIEEEIVQRIGRSMGFDPLQISEITKQIAKQMDETRAMLFGVSVQDLQAAAGDVRALKAIVAKKGLIRPEFATQLANSWLMANPITIRKYFKQAAGMRQELSASIARHLGKAVPPATIKSFDAAVIAKNIASYSADMYLKVWKPSVILSGRYILRVTGDEKLRQLADLGFVDTILGSKVYAKTMRMLGRTPRARVMTASLNHSRYMNEVAQAAGWGHMEDVYNYLRAKKMGAPVHEYNEELWGRLTDRQRAMFEAAADRPLTPTNLSDRHTVISADNAIGVYNSTSVQARGVGADVPVDTILIDVDLANAASGPRAGHEMNFLRGTQEKKWYGDQWDFNTQVTMTLEHELNHRAFKLAFTGDLRDEVGWGIRRNQTEFQAWQDAVVAYATRKSAAGKYPLHDTLGNLSEISAPVGDGGDNIIRWIASPDSKAFNAMHEVFADAFNAFKFTPEKLKQEAFELWKWFDDHADFTTRIFQESRKNTRVIYINKEAPVSGGVEYVIEGRHYGDLAVEPSALSRNGPLSFYESLQQREAGFLAQATRGQAKGFRDWGVVWGKEKSWAPTADKVLRRDWAMDIYGQRILVGIRDNMDISKIIDDIVHDLFNTREGRNYRINMSWPKNEVMIRDMFEEKAATIAKVTNGRNDIAAAALADDPGLIHMLNELPVDARAPIHGVRADLVFSEANPFRSAFDTVARYVFEAPTNFLTRQPTYRSWYMRVKESLLTQLEAEDVVRVKAGLKPVGFDESMERAVDNIAREFAANRVTDIMFDFRRQSRFAEMLRFVAPFLQPYMEAISVWGHLIRQNPAFMITAGVVNRTFEQNKLIESDPFSGEERIPMTNFLFGGTLLNTAFGGAPNTPGWTLSAPLVSFNFLFGSVFDLPIGEGGKYGAVPIPVPSFSPPVQWLMQKFATSDLIPDHFKYSAFQWAYQYGSLQGAYKFTTGLLPTPLAHMVESWIPESDLIDSLAVDFVRLYEGRGMTPESYAEEMGISVAEAQETISKMAENQARDLMRWRALFSVLFPSAPTIHFPQQDIEQEWRVLTNEVGYDEAKEVFLDKYPEWSYITIGSSTWEKAIAGSDIQIPASRRIEELMLQPEFEEFAQKYPRWFFAIIPKEFYEDEFSREAYFRQIDAGWRGSLSPLEFYQKADTRAGWEIWRSTNEAWENLQADMTANNIAQSSVTWQNAEKEYRDAVDSLGRLYPGFNAQYTRFEEQSIDPLIWKEMTSMLEVPMFRETEVGQGIEAWLALYKRTDAMLAEKNIRNITSSTAERYGISQMYEAEVEKLIKKYPQFELVYNTYLQDALRNVETLADQVLDALTPEQERYFQEWDIRWGGLMHEANEGALNSGEAAVAYQEMRDMSAQAWKSFPDKENNPQWIWWQTRTAYEQEDYLRGIATRPFAFLSRFDLELLEIDANEQTDEMWSQVGNLQAQISYIVSTNPSAANVGELYDLVDSTVKDFAEQDPLFAAQVQRANTWGSNLYYVLMSDNDTMADETWRELFNTLGSLQEIANLQELHGVNDPNPANEARYRELRLILEDEVRYLKTINPQFAAEWEELESRPGFMVETLIPDNYFPLGVTE